MADRVGYKVEGLTKVTRALQQLGIEIEDLKDAFSKIAREGAVRAAAHAPRRSGRLAASVRGNRAKSSAVVTSGKSAAPYAGAINYGWPARNISASSFMQKADEEMRPRAIKLLEDDINAKAKSKGLT